MEQEKLAELLEIDVSNLIRFNSVYLKLKNVSSPSIDTFTEYAETDEELSRLAACEKLIDVIKEIKLSTPKNRLLLKEFIFLRDGNIFDQIKILLKGNFRRYSNFGFFVVVFGAFLKKI